MKLSDLIDHVEYVSDDKGSLKCAEISETSEDGKILNVYCLYSMTLSNLIVISDNLEEEIGEVLIDVPCRMKIHLNDIDVSSRTCSFTCDLYKFHVFIEGMSNGRKFLRQVELQINADLESRKINLLELLEIRPVLKSLE